MAPTRPAGPTASVTSLSSGNDVASGVRDAPAIPRAPRGRRALRSWFDSHAPRSPLLPASVAVALIAAVGLLAQVIQIANPIAREYRPPVAIPPMARTQADLAPLILAVEASRSGAANDEQIRAHVMRHDEWGRPFPYPPFVYRVLAPLGMMSERAAGVGWLAAFLLAFPLALGWYLSRAHPGLRGHRPALLVLVLLAFTMSASMLLQLERGDFDWLVGAVYLASLVAIASERRWAGGVLLGIAVSLNVYPVLLVAVLLALRRWRELFAAAATLVLVFLLTGPSNNLAWLAALRADRGNWLIVNAWNTSLANGLAWAWPGLARGVVEKLALGLFVALLAAAIGVVAWRARKGARYSVAQLGVVLLPFMFLVPSTTWSYTLFLLLPILFAVAEGYEALPERRAALLFAAGLIGVCQTPIVGIALRDPFWGRALTPVYSLCLLGLVVTEIWLLGHGWCSMTGRAEHRSDAVC